MKPSHKTLAAYQKGFELAIKIFKLTRKFPDDEKYSLTDQIKRSSRSVCANIGEAYRKNKYIKDYTSKLSISDSELGETQVWLDICHGCEYITDSEYETLYSLSEECGRLVGYMLRNPGTFGVDLTKKTL
jgi:four helix bundle protein